MAAVGAFTVQSDDGFAGAGRALAIPSRPSRSSRSAKCPADKSPDFRVFAGKAEFGTNLERPAGRRRLSVGQVGHLSFGAAINVALVVIEGVHSRARSRGNGPKTDLSGPPAPPTGGAGAAREGWRRRRHRV